MKLWVRRVGFIRNGKVVGGIDDLLVEFKNGIRSCKKMFWNFRQVGIQTNAEVGFLLANLLNELRACHGRES